MRVAALGLSLGLTNVTERSAVRYWATVAVPVSVSVLPLSEPAMPFWLLNASASCASPPVSFTVADARFALSGSLTSRFGAIAVAGSFSV